MITRGKVVQYSTVMSHCMKYKTKYKTRYEPWYNGHDKYKL